MVREGNGGLRTEVLPGTERSGEDHIGRIAALVKRAAGLDLHEGKRELIKARLVRRIHRLGLESFDQYADLLLADGTGSEFRTLLDLLTTNVTRFFREPGHFDHLKNVVLPRELAACGGKGLRLRIWSAGCSSGEEPYSIAVTVKEKVPRESFRDVKILGTDLSDEMLALARAGVYREESLDGVPPSLLRGSFELFRSDPERLYRVAAPLRGLVLFARLNLMEPWPMKGPFDVIFCRNVMIYCEKETRRNLVGRFRKILKPGGTLFLGLSESLSGLGEGFRFVKPGVYEKAPRPEERSW